MISVWDCLPYSYHQKPSKKTDRPEKLSNKVYINFHSSRYSQLCPLIQWAHQKTIRLDCIIPVPLDLACHDLTSCQQISVRIYLWSWVKYLLLLRIQPLCHLYFSQDQNKSYCSQLLEYFLSLGHQCCTLDTLVMKTDKVQGNVSSSWMTIPNGLFKQKVRHFIVKTLSFGDDTVQTILILSEKTGNWNQFFKKSLHS